jgi:hypothetical protein
MSPEKQSQRSLSPEFTKNLSFFRLILVATLLLHCVGLYAFLRPVYTAGLLLTSKRWLLISGLGVTGFLIELALLITTWVVNPGSLRRVVQRLVKFLGRLRNLNLVIYLLIFGAGSLALFVPIYDQYTPEFWTLLLAYWLVALSGCIFWKAWGQKYFPEFQRSWVDTLGFTLLLTTFGFRIVLSLQDISSYPFTLGWSETSRFYYASLFFSKAIYGIRVPPTVLHPSRYLMQSIPFLLPGSPLWLHRAWQVFLWIGTSLLTAWVLLRRLKISHPWYRSLFLVAGFIFLLIGPVYYHLQIPIILILWGFKPVSGKGKDSPGKKQSRLQFLKSLAVLLAASAWAGISRVNWYPVPGLLAASLYLLEKPFTGETTSDTQPSGQNKFRWQRFVMYILEPAAWVLLGTATAIAANALYILWSGNPADQFASSLSSSLLWYRLLPSATYLPGILPGSLLVSLPLLVLIFYAFKPVKQPAGQDALSSLPAIANWKNYHPLRFLGLGAVLLVLFVGGLVVSIKIGGGSNLHNMDAYMVLLLVVSTSIVFGQFVPETNLQPQPQETLNSRSETTSETTSETINEPPAHPRLYLPPWLSALSVAILVIFSFMGNSVRAALPDQAATEKGLSIITQRVEEASQQGEVLMVSNRHLLTFHYFQGVPLVPDYERVFLMEMAMAGNAKYLGRLQEDLANHRFSLIITEPLYLKIKDETAEFGEENNIWIKQVVRLLRCYYIEDENDDDEKFMLREMQIQFLIPDPKPNPARCSKE